MPRVRPNAGAKWARRAGSATQEFTEGVASPRQNWKQATMASEQAHRAGTEAALREKRFVKGVQASTDERWMTKTLGKGAARFAQGVADAQQDYETGVAPYTNALNSVVLPPRGPKGDPNNINRVIAVNKALRQVKTGQS